MLSRFISVVRKPQPSTRANQVERKPSAGTRAAPSEPHDDTDPASDVHRKCAEYSEASGRPYLTLSDGNWNDNGIAEGMAEFLGKAAAGDRLAARHYTLASGEKKIELYFAPKRSRLEKLSALTSGELYRESVAARIVLQRVGASLGVPQWAKLQTRGFSKAPRRLEAEDQRNKFNEFCSHPKKFSFNGEEWVVEKDEIGTVCGNESNPILLAISSNGEKMVLKPMGYEGSISPAAYKESAIYKKLSRAGKNSNILGFRGEFVFGSKRFLCTEYADSGTLRGYSEKIRDSDARRETKQSLLLESLRGVISGMRQMKEAGYLHFDIKCENFFVQTDKGGESVTKLADFGTAENIVKKKWAISPGDAVKYMSPELIGLYYDRDNRFANDKLTEIKERIKGRRVILNDSTLVALNNKRKALDRKISNDRREFSAAADVWPLGPVVYELFCGELSSERIAAARGDGGKEPRPLKLKVKGIFTHQDVRDALNMLILNVMKHDPKDRWSIDRVSDFFDQHLSQFLPE